MLNFESTYSKMAEISTNTLMISVWINEVTSIVLIWKLMQEKLLSYIIESISDSKVVKSCIHMIIMEGAFQDIFCVVIIKVTYKTVQKVWEVGLTQGQ